MLRSSWIIMMVLLAAGWATSGDTVETPADTASTPPADSALVALTDEAATILDAFCSACHAGAQGAAGLDLTRSGIEARLIDVASTQLDTLLLVDTTRPQRSYLLMKMHASEGIVGRRMPLGGRLSDEMIGDIEAWILALAEARAASPADSTAEAAGATPAGD